MHAARRRVARCALWHDAPPSCRRAHPLVPAAPLTTAVKVNTTFHVVHGDMTYLGGYLSEKDVKAQMKVRGCATRPCAPSAPLRTRDQVTRSPCKQRGRRGWAQTCARALKQQPRWLCLTLSARRPTALQVLSKAYSKMRYTFKFKIQYHLDPELFENCNRERPPPAAAGWHAAQCQARCCACADSAQRSARPSHCTGLTHALPCPPPLCMCAQRPFVRPTVSGASAI